MFIINSINQNYIIFIAQDSEKYIPKNDKWLTLIDFFVFTS